MQRLALIGAALFTLLLAILAGLVLLYQQRTPMVSPAATRYAAERAIYAPGETLRFTSTLTIAHAGVVSTTRGWRRASDYTAARDCHGRVIPATTRNDIAPYPVEAVGVSITTPLTATVPLLPRGSYLYVSAVDRVVYSVPVKIERSC